MAVATRETMHEVLQLLSSQVMRKSNPDCLPRGLVSAFVLFRITFVPFLSRLTAFAAE